MINEIELDENEIDDSPDISQENAVQLSDEEIKQLLLDARARTSEVRRKAILNYLKSQRGSGKPQGKKKKKGKR
jgi:hypothetical protein